MRVATGTYTGNAIQRDITGVGFDPTMVWVKGTSGSGHPVSRTPSNTGTTSNQWSTGSQPTSGIRALITDGFTIGTGTPVNGDGIAYNYVAFLTDDAVWKTGEYTGDGNDNRDITGVGFQPDFVIVHRAGGTQTTFRNTARGGDFSQTWAASSGFTNGIQAVSADGFQVGTRAEVNVLDIAYQYICFREATDNLDTGTYEGNGADDRNVATPFGFQFVLAVGNGGLDADAAYRIDTLSGDLSWVQASSDAQANGIQALTATNFQVGTIPNINAVNYYWLGFADLLAVPALPAPVVPVGGLTGAAFPVPDEEYSSYKSMRYLWSRFTNARFY